MPTGGRRGGRSSQLRSAAKSLRRTSSERWGRAPRGRARPRRQRRRAAHPWPAQRRVRRPRRVQSSRLEAPTDRWDKGNSPPAAQLPPRSRFRRREPTTRRPRHPARGGARAAGHTRVVSPFVDRTPLLRPGKSPAKRGLSSGPVGSITSSPSYEARPMLPQLRPRPTDAPAAQPARLAG